MFLNVPRYVSLSLARNKLYAQLEVAGQVSNLLGPRRAGAHNKSLHFFLPIRTLLLKHQR